MKKQIKLLGRSVEFLLKKNRRSKNIRLIVHSNGIFVVTAPKWVSEKVIEKFLIEKAEWIMEKLGKAKKALLYTLIGAAILLGSWAIAILISQTVLSL